MMRAIGGPSSLQGGPKLRGPEGPGTVRGTGEPLYIYLPLRCRKLLAITKDKKLFCLQQYQGSAIEVQPETDYLQKYSTSLNQTFSTAVMMCSRSKS